MGTHNILRYPGGKFRTRKALYNLVKNLPHKNVFSGFLGGASFELFLTENNSRVDGIDIFKCLVNFWQQISLYPKEIANILYKEIGQINKESFISKKEKLISFENNTETLSNDELLRLAADFFIVNRCSFSGATLSGGYSQESAKSRFTYNSIKKIEDYTNNNLTVKHEDFFKLLETDSTILEQYDLVFLDPPYLLDSHKNKLYGISGDLHQDFNHEKLSQILKTVNTNFLLTYNDCQEIRHLYSFADIKENVFSYGMGSNKTGHELVITNFPINT